MTEKTTIKREQVVSEKAGMVSYINDQSTLMNAKASTLTIIEDEASAPAEPAPLPEAPVTEPAANAAPAPEAQPETPKPPKAKKAKKTKETDEMATPQARPAAKKALPPKAKAKAKASTAPKEAGVRTIGGKPVDISQYEKTKTAAGGTSYHNGDQVAELLAGKSLDECYAIAAKRLKVEEKELRAKYKKLNSGMQRMNLGNRLRKVVIAKDKH